MTLWWEFLPFISDLCRCFGRRENSPTQQASVYLITWGILLENNGKASQGGTAPQS